jgi:AraC-like DNA-binding protein
VDCLWYTDDPAPTHHRERALPTGTVEVVFSLTRERFRIFANDADQSGQQFRGSVICGPQPGYFVLDTSRGGAVAGIHFKPVGAAAFFDMPVSEFTGSHIALEDIWGSEARWVRERLLAAASPEAIFRLMEEALVERMQRPVFLNSALDFAIGQFDTSASIARIRQVQDEVGYAPKRFIELFRNAVGLTPKLYCRIQRFQAVIEQLSRQQKVEWAGVAVDGGFYDQSHLNREFRAFSGVTPTAYRPIADDRPNHVAINP